MTPSPSRLRAIVREPCSKLVDTTAEQITAHRTSLQDSVSESGRRADVQSETAAICDRLVDRLTTQNA
jgi:hypothetical protein